MVKQKRVRKGSLLKFSYFDPGLRKIGFPALISGSCLLIGAEVGVDQIVNVLVQALVAFLFPVRFDHGLFAFGYVEDAAVVYPDEEDYRLDKPQLVKKGAGYGVQFRAKAPSYHIVKVNVTGSVNPIIGTKQQGEDFVNDTLKTYQEGDAVWETNIFGKSLRSLVGDELAGKTNAMPVELRKKMRRSISKIVNDGKNNVLCIVF